MLHLGADSLAVDILGEVEDLTERGVGKLMTQEVVLLILRAVLVATAFVTIDHLLLLVEANHELVVAIKLHLEVILGHARSSNLDLELFVSLDDVDLRCGATLRI